MREFDNTSMDIVTVNQVCEVTGKTRSEVLKAIKTGELSAHKKGYVRNFGENFGRGAWIIFERDAWAFDMRVNNKRENNVPQVKPEDNRELEDNRKPSEVTDAPWLFARCSPDCSRDMLCEGECDDTGKWMIFAERGEALDDLWMKVKEAVVNGLCWQSAKVSTALKNPTYADDTKGVICVRTYDGTDEADAMRVREVLRELGVTWKIPYKLDQTTRSGEYSFNTKGRVSLYYC